MRMRLGSKWSIKYSSRRLLRMLWRKQLLCNRRQRQRQRWSVSVDCMRSLWRKSCCWTRSKSCKSIHSLSPGSQAIINLNSGSSRRCRHLKTAVKASTRSTQIRCLWSQPRRSVGRALRGSSWEDRHNRSPSLALALNSSSETVSRWQNLPWTRLIWKCYRDCSSSSSIKHLRYRHN